MQGSYVRQTWTEVGLQTLIRKASSDVGGEGVSSIVAISAL